MSTTPLDGQTYPSFPTSWYQDVTPDRPFNVVSPSPIPPPPIYKPPPQLPPPYSGSTNYRLMVVPYDLGMLGWQKLGAFGQTGVSVAKSSTIGVAMGRGTYATVTVNASGDGAATGRSNIIAVITAHASGNGAASGTNRSSAVAHASGNGIASGR